MRLRVLLINVNSISKRLDIEGVVEFSLVQNISVVLDKPYRDKSWHTTNKFFVAFLLFIITVKTLVRYLITTIYSIL